MPIIDVIYQDAEQREQRISAAIEKEQVSLLYGGDCLPFIRSLPQHPLFDLVVTSPPYNIGKTYEKGMLRSRAEYVAWQEEVIRSLYPLIREHGSICWQVGNYVDHGAIVPLDLDLAAIFERLGMRLRNRIIWTFGHGLHCKKRFSGRYEVILLYTKSDTTFSTWTLSESRQSTLENVRTRDRGKGSSREILWERIPRMFGTSPM